MALFQAQGILGTMRESMASPHTACVLMHVCESVCVEEKLPVTA